MLTEHMLAFLKQCVRNSYMLAEKMCTLKSYGGLHRSGYPVYALPSGVVLLKRV